MAGGAAKALADLFSLPNGPKRLAYVSCNPKSFARDAKELAVAGLTLESISPVDLFPGAMHLELVAAFFLKKNAVRSLTYPEANVRARSAPADVSSY